MITINGIRWHILLCAPNNHNLKRHTGSYAIASCDVNQKIIFISNDIQPRYMKKVLTHEIVHAIIFSYGIELSLDDEEKFADLIATYGHLIPKILNDII